MPTCEKGLYLRRADNTCRMCEDTLLSLSEDECVQACGENESEVTGSLGQRYCACDDPKVVQIVGGAKKCLNEAPTCETNM